MKKILLAVIAALLSIVAWANDYDQNKPFGFCTVSSRTDNTSTYNITGGGCYTYPVPDELADKTIVLKSTGQDMKGTIQNAIKQNSIVILDGSDGDFIVSSNVGITTSNKTIIGINNARICTKWYLTDEDKTLLDNAVDSRTPDIKGVKNMSTNADDDLGGSVGGSYVKEQAEFMTRKTLYEKYGNEDYRQSGVISLINCSNIIIRNISFVGPGSVDVGGNDLISSTGAKNIWVDHCTFMDGMDGNFDITQKADFHTVSWCIFRYTDRSYVHQNTNLIGSSDSETTGYLNTTFAFNWWAPGCNQRMPMARVGKIHMLNNYFSSTTASNCINPRKNSEFIIDGNYFAKGVKKYYSQSDATAVTWTSNNYIAEASSLPASTGATVTIPYEYTPNEYGIVPDAVQNYAGPTLDYYSGETSGTKGNIYWAMSSNTDATVSTTISDYIENVQCKIGSNLTTNGTKTSGDKTFTQVRATTPVTQASENDIVTFSFSPKSNYKFKATQVIFYACKIATDNGNIDAQWIDDGGTQSLVTGSSPSRNKQDSQMGYNFYSEYDKNLNTLSTESEGTCTLKLYLYNVGFIKDNVITQKDLGLAQIIIKGNIIDKTTGISTPVTLSPALSTEYYTLGGQRVNATTKGVVIMRQRYADGTTKTTKVIR